MASALGDARRWRRCFPDFLRRLRQHNPSLVSRWDEDRFHFQSQRQHLAVDTDHSWRRTNGSRCARAEVSKADGQDFTEGSGRVREVAVSVRGTAVSHRQVDRRQKQPVSIRPGIIVRQILRHLGECSRLRGKSPTSRNSRSMPSNSMRRDVQGAPAWAALVELFGVSVWRFIGMNSFSTSCQHRLASFSPKFSMGSATQL